MAEILQEYMNEFNQLKSERMLWEPDWDDIAKFTVPNQYYFQRQMELDGQDRTQSLFDGTAPNALTKWVALLQSLGTNASTEWFQLKLPPGIDPDEDSRDYLDRQTGELLALFDRDGFYKACDSYYESLGLFGNGTMLVEEKPVKGEGFQGYRFHTYPLNEVWFKANSEQKIRTQYRKIRMTANQIIGEFPDASLPDEIRDGAKQFSSTKYCVVHCVKPVDVNEPDGECLSVWFMESPAIVLRNSTYKEFPFIIARYRVSCNENYGRGPAGEVIGPIRLLNHLQKRGVQAADMSVLGTIAVQEGVEFDIENMRPGRVVTIGDINGFKEIQRNINPQLFEYVRGDNVNQVRAAFFQDQIDLDMRRPEYAKAEAIMEQSNRNRLVLAPLFNSLHSEFYIPLINRAYQLKKRAEDAAGVEVPAQIKEHGMDVAMQSPLAKSQLQVNLQAKRAFTQDFALKYQLHPEVGDVIDWDNWVKSDAEENGVKFSSIFRPQRDVEAIRRERQRVQAQQAQLAALQQGAPAMLDIAKANEIQRGGA